jgi:hypothetical protein
MAQFYAVIPAEIDVTSSAWAVRGHVKQERSLSLKEVLAIPRAELAAANQCSWNSHGFFCLTSRPF